MNIAQIGVGLGGLAYGVRQGLEIGGEIKKIRNENRIDDARQAGIKEAGVVRQADIDKMIVPRERGPGVTVYDVGGTEYATPELARTAAEAKADPLTSYYSQTVYPKVYEAYIAQGDMEKASAWQNWYEDETTRTGMKHWSAAANAAARGDADAFAESMVKLYNSDGYYDDGIDAKGVKPMKDADGNLTGFEVEFFDKNTEKTYTQTFQGSDDLLRSAIQSFSPAQAFEFAWSEYQAGQKFESDRALLDYKHGQNLELIGARAAADNTATTNKTAQELSTKLGVLKQWGFNDAQIKELVPELLGVGDRKGVSLADTRRMVWDTLMKSDLSFAKRPPEEQAAAVDQVLTIIGAGGAMPSGNPAAGGIGIAEPGVPSAGVPGPGNGVPVLDTETGEIVYY